MTIIRYECGDPDHYRHVLVSVPNRMKHAHKGAIDLPCEECGRAMVGRFI